MLIFNLFQIYTKAEMPFAKLNDNSVLERLKNDTLEWNIPGSMPERLGALLVSSSSRLLCSQWHFDLLKYLPVVARNCNTSLTGYT